MFHNSENLTLVGVTVAEAKPVGIQNVRLFPGLNVLYGKNGVGKTRLLEATARVIHGFGKNHFDPTPFQMALYSSGGIHIRRIPDADQVRRYHKNGKTFFSRNLLAEEAVDESDKPGFDWRGHGWDAWISAFLLSLPWERGRLDDNVFGKGRSFSRARELGLSHSEWLWLLDQDRWFIRPGDGAVFLCDPDPYSGPLRKHWEESQSKWAEYFAEVAADALGDNEGKLVWEPIEGRWELPWLRRNVSRFPPLPEILGLESFPDWVGFPILEIDPEVIWWPHIDSMLEIEDIHEDVVWSPLEDSIIDFLMQAEERLERHRNRGIRLIETMVQVASKSNEIPKSPMTLSEVCRDLEGRVNRTLAHLFADPPKVRISDARAPRLSKSSPVAIQAQVGSEGPWFPITSLGHAHRRFVFKALSIELLRDNNFLARNRLFRRFRDNNPLYASYFADRDLPYEDPEVKWPSISSPTIAFVDEPEAGLHPQAERILSEGIHHLAEYVLVTTHSTKLLNRSLKSGSAQLVERERDGSFRLTTNIPRLSTSLTNVFEQLFGLDPADVVSLISAFVLVEGAHDRAVIEHLLEDRLKELMVEIVPMQGTKGVADLVTSPFLFASTSAPIVVALDNGKQSLVESLLQDLREAVEIHRQRQVRNLYIREFEASLELKAILNLVTQAIELRRLDRIHPFVFSKRDILEYIPMSCFSDRFPDWEEANREFLKANGRTHFQIGDGKNKKQWLTRNGVDCREPGIRAALKQWSVTRDGVPEEFESLIELLSRVSRATPII